jgi:serine/threonine-protein kinase
MGQIYRAWDPSLRRDVAIKVLNVLETDLLTRFSREALAISQLNNPNVVKINDFRVDKGAPYIVMEYLRGEDLATKLRRGPMAVAEAVDMILGVCAGVHACHRLGIIHRDLKPGNVFLNETPEFGVVVKVLDFGVAMLARSAGEDDFTRPGQVVGTPRYVSPEQVRHYEADAKSDQYAIGLLLYVALAGKSPFGKKEGAELARAILKAEYPQLREIRAGISEGLDRAIAKAMNVDKDQRYASVLALGQAVLEHATIEGQASWTDRFPSADEPHSPNSDIRETLTKRETPETRVAPGRKGDAADAVDSIMQVSTMDGDVSVSIKGPVVIPVAPLDEGPPSFVDTTARLRTETAIDFSQAARDRVGRLEKTSDLHLWSEQHVGSAAGGGELQPRDDDSRIEAPVGLWQRKRVLVAGALALVVLLGACIAWLAAR